MKLTTATISYHMQALIDAGLVSVEKSDNRLYFQVHKEHLHQYLKQAEQRNPASVNAGFHIIYKIKGKP